MPKDTTLHYSISPLPLGPKKDWSRLPHHIVGARFANSELQNALAERQLGIDMSQGMMASPATGSLLFRLKTRDLAAPNLNRDGDFGTLLGRTGITAVFGSSVGGTGASVGPTVAEMLGERGHDVLAVMY